MTTITNNYFWIGRSHTINQDYCLSGSYNGINYALVCDGCSSSPDTDFGARILARAAVNNVQLFDSEHFAPAVISAARTQASSLGLDSNALDATLVMAVELPDKRIIAKCFGDGHIVLLTENETQVYSFSFESGAPLYLNYFLNEQRYKRYKEEFGLAPKFSFNHEVSIYDSFDFLDKEYFDLTTFRNGKTPEDSGYELYFLKQYLYSSDIKGIFVCSDGFDSFIREEETSTSKTIKKVNNEEVFDSFFNFKQTNGTFLERRAKRFLKNCRDNHWYNSDDCSVAGMIFNKE